MQRPRPIKITDLNPHLMCVLCGGYYVDATTIIECLHSFCKSCIVRYLETNKYCPICDVQVHKSKPLLNIRQDQTLQNIVYKLVPGLYQSELKSRREFYNQHPENKPVNSEDAGELSKISQLFLPDEAVSLSLEYGDTPSSQDGSGRRYLQCPAAVTVYHLQKLVRAKFGLSENHKIELMYAQEYLPEYLSLMDIAYIYQWKRKSPIHLTYHILECQRKKIKLSHEPSTTQGDNSTNNIKSSPTTKENSIQSETKPDISEENQLTISKTVKPSDDKKTSNEWKEVQLQISENGIMSVTDVQPVTIEEHLITKNQEEKNPVNLSPLVNNATCVNSMLSDTRPGEKYSSVAKDLSSCDNVKKFKPETVELVKIPEPNSAPKKQENSETNVNKCKASDSTKCKDKDHLLIEVKLDKPTAIKSSEIVSCPKPINIVKESSSNTNKDLLAKSPIPINKSESLSVTTRPVGFQKVYPGIKPSQNFQVMPKDGDLKKCSTQVSGINQKLNQEGSHSSSGTKKLQSQPIRYKTLKCPTKPWNPSIARSTMLSMKHSQAANSKDSSSESNETQSQIKPPRFFKMRNMPRFLGNPASGVKPMYQVAPGSELGNQSPNSTTPRSPKQGNTSITLMKIDPKTLSPIAMTPATPQTINSPRTTSSPPVQSNKFPPPFTPGSPKHHSNHFPNCRTPLHLQTNKKKTQTPRVPSPAHSGSLIHSNPFLSSVPHSTNPHLMYSGFSGPFSPTDPTGNNRLLTGTSSQLIRAMSGLCPPSAAFHPSLPPSISMLFNPHHAHHRHNQSDRPNFKPISNESQKTLTPPPTVQRIPPSSGPTTKTSSESSQSSSHFNKMAEEKMHQTNMNIDLMESNSVPQNTKINNIRSNHLTNDLKKQSVDSALKSPSVMISTKSKVLDSGTDHDLNKNKELSREVNGPLKDSQKSLSKGKEYVNNIELKSCKDNGEEQVNSVHKEKVSEEVKTSCNIESKEISVTSSVTINNNPEKVNKSTDNSNLVTELINKNDAQHHKS